MFKSDVKHEQTNNQNRDKCVYWYIIYDAYVIQCFLTSRIHVQVFASYRHSDVIKLLFYREIYDGDF